MKLYFISIFFLSFSILKINSQNDTTLSKNKGLDVIEFTAFNYAERVSKGLLQYTLIEDSLIIRNKVFFGKKVDTIVWAQKIGKQLLETISKINLDTLKRSYDNYCIMMFSGNKYSLLYAKNGFERRISIHHYYHPVIHSIIKKINLYVPDYKYLIRYVPANIKQDCKF